MHERGQSLAPYKE